MAEGAPLLREYRVNSSIEGSNPSFSAIQSSAKQDTRRETPESPQIAGFFVSERVSDAAGDRNSRPTLGLSLRWRLGQSLFASGHPAQ